MTPLEADKQALRRTLRARRKALAVARREAASLALRDHFLARFPDLEGPVAGFWPIGSEIDPRPLMAALAERGARLALPVAERAEAPLVFRLWRPGDALAPDANAVPAPSADKAGVDPAVILTPLLGFDADGGRLGGGRGAYDRTFAACPAAWRIGLSFALQQVDHVPMAEHDFPLHAIATETGVRCIGAS